LKTDTQLFTQFLVLIQTPSMSKEIVGSAAKQKNTEKTVYS